MENIFSGSEIAALGVQIEINGRDFYEAIANKSKRKPAREIFEYLKGEEERHIAAFGKILDSVQRYKPQESYQGEYLAYMKALASGHVFTQKDNGKEIARKIKTDKEAVRMAIGFEKDSIIFYEGMKKTVLEREARAVEELIKQEQNHLLQLINLKNTL